MRRTEPEQTVDDYGRTHYEALHGLDAGEASEALPDEWETNDPRWSTQDAIINGDDEENNR